MVFLFCNFSEKVSNFPASDVTFGDSQGGHSLLESVELSYAGELQKITRLLSRSPVHRDKTTAKAVLKLMNAEGLTILPCTK